MCGDRSLDDRLGVVRLYGVSGRRNNRQLFRCSETSKDPVNRLKQRFKLYAPFGI